MKYAKGEATAGGTLLLFILFLIVLGVVWVYTGGPSRPISLSGPFLSPPLVPQIPIGGGAGQPGGIQADQGAVQATNPFSSYRGVIATADISPYASSVTLRADNTQTTDPKNEYISIRIEPGLKNTVTLSGWKIVDDGSGAQVNIGMGVQIPFLGQVNTADPITLTSNSTVYVTTGRSPNGVSYRLNECTGYFAQSQQWSPSLPSECPSPTKELARSPNLANEQACANFVQSLPTCQIYTSSVPGSIGSACQSFVLNELSYNGCVSTHKNDADFYRNEWRVFLNRDQELWKGDHGGIRLLDENGKVVAAVSY